MFNQKNNEAGKPDESINLDQSEMIINDKSQVDDSLVLNLDDTGEAPAAPEAGSTGPSFISRLISKLFSKKENDGSEAVAISTIMIDSQISTEQLNGAIAGSEKKSKTKNTSVVQITLTGLAIVSAVGAGLVINARSNLNERITLASASSLEVQGTARNLPKLAQSAAFGDKAAIEAIESFRNRIQENAKNILTFSNDKALNAIVKDATKAVEGIASRKDKLSGVGANLTQVRSSGEQVKGAAEQVQSIIIQKAASEETALIAARLRTTAGRLSARIDEIVSGSSPALAINAFNNDISAIQENMNEISSDTSLIDPDISGRMAALSKATTDLRGYSGEIRASLLDVVEARRSADLLSKYSEQLIKYTEAADKDIESGRGDLSYYQLAAAILALLAVSLLAGVFLVNAMNEKRRAKQIETEKRKTEVAIERMLSEIVPISGGDLRARITVTDDITGVIADAVNLTVDALSGVVRDINRSSSDVEDSTKSFVSTIEKIADRVNDQAAKVDEANVSVGNLTDSIKLIFESAGRSYTVAQESLEAADNGVQTVQETIYGMGQIRDNIAETSKRIKRLGESSQEIGEIADVIMDITNKTNILALNAFVQAAGAGEQGRGFRVIAAEIQELAKQSDSSLARVTGLIQAIQNDMREAIAAMERSTHGVVEGTSSANSAGDALKAIKEISENLAELIAGITNATESQSEDAQQVTDNMAQVLQIANESAVLANESKGTVENIGVTVASLGKSVAGFQA